MAYNPREAYFARMNSTQRKNSSSRSTHQYSGSIGGDSSNYQQNKSNEESNDSSKDKTSKGCKNV